MLKRECGDSLNFEKLSDLLMHESRQENMTHFFLTAKSHDMFIESFDLVAVNNEHNQTA